MVVVVYNVGSSSTDILRHATFPIAEVGEQVAMLLPKHLSVICLHERPMKFKSISVSSSHKFALALGNIYPAYPVLCIFMLYLGMAGHLSINVVVEFRYRCFEIVNLLEQSIGKEVWDSTAAPKDT